MAKALITLITALALCVGFADSTSRGLRGTRRRRRSHNSARRDFNARGDTKRGSWKKSGSSFRDRDFAQPVPSINVGTSNSDKGASYEAFRSNKKKHKTSSGFADRLDEEYAKAHKKGSPKGSPKGESENKEVYSEEIERISNPCPDENCITREYIPVLCNSTCQYDNQGCAEGAGYSNEQCELVERPVNPIPPISIPLPFCPVYLENECNFAYEPIICNGCPYDNRCHAQAFLTAYPGTECVPVPFLCPQVPEGTCDDAVEGGPYVCGPGCEYENKCLTQAYNGPGNCAAKPPEACPIAFLTEKCGDVTPTRCGSCDYENSCLANASYPNPDECEPIVRPIPEPLPQLCPRYPENESECLDSPIDPYRCGECKYQNLCHTQAFIPQSICVPDCPVAINVAPCDQDVPVTCGSCNYNNICEAQGYQGEIECVECPRHSGTCPENYDPVVCGECEYSNRCFAQGYPSQDECAPKLKPDEKRPENEDCPQNYGFCTADYNPVVCGNCTYSNRCKAKNHPSRDECVELRVDPPPERQPIGGMPALDLREDQLVYPKTMCYDTENDTCKEVSDCEECPRNTKCTNDAGYECGQRACRSSDIEGANGSDCKAAACNDTSGCDDGYKCIPLFASRYTNQVGCIAYEGL